MVQDILLQTNNVLFRKEKCYSAASEKTYLAKLPRDYDGQFEPSVKTLILALYFGMGASEPKILEFFANFSGDTPNIDSLLLRDRNG